MLLQRLREYSERPEVARTRPPSLYAEMPVRYIIDLRLDGMSEGVTDTADTSVRGAARGVRRQVPFIVRTSATRPLLYADNGEYTFGLTSSGRAERAAERHADYMKVVAECAEATDLREARAVLTFLLNGSEAGFGLPDDFDGAGTTTFRVDGQFVVDLPAVQQFWAERFAPPANETEDSGQQCFVCGEEQPLRENVSGLVKGIPGGQPAGTALVFSSERDSPFNSYGVRSKACAGCEELFTRALNGILAGESSRIRFGSSIYAFWTREPEASFNPFELLDRAEPDDVKVFFSSILASRRAVPQDPNRFYAVALSAAGGRAVVREWIDVTLPDAQDALARWFDWQAVIDINTGEKRYFSVRALGGATVKKLSDISPPTTRSLLRYAFKGGRLPMDLMSAAVRRAQADGGPNAAHIALIKLVLLSNVPEHEPTPEEDTLVSLQTDHPRASYQCGRLMAVLDRIQREAIPNVKSGVVDRYFGTASSSPQGVFPRLLKGARPHLNVLRQERPGAYRALEAQLDEVLSHLSAEPGATAFPRTLPLAEQGLFLLGFHHQRAEDRAQARAGAERRRARATAGDADGGDDVAASDEDGADE